MIPFGTVECERLSVLATAFVLALWAGGFAAGGSEKIVVTNNCPITLWIHFTEMPYTADINGGKAQKMLPNTTLVYDSLPDFGAGRCWAYYKDPGTAVNKYAPISSYNGFVENDRERGRQGCAELQRFFCRLCYAAG